MLLPDRPSGQHLSRHLDNLEMALALAMAVALPWELFQRVPPFEITLVKAAGALLVLAVAARTALERRCRVRQTGLELPMLALLAVMALSTLASQNRAASLSQLAMHASYFLMFCAVAAVVCSEPRARRIAAAFVASSAAVGALALACRLGLATPAVVDTTRITGRWTDQQSWFDLTSRMAPASADFNQGALPLLAAFCLALFLFLAPRDGRKWPALSAALLSLAGVVITLSRSSMLLAAALGALFVVTGLRRGSRRGAAAFAGSATAAVILLAVLMGPSGFLDRMTKLAAQRDSSYESRVAAFEAGYALLPEYWLVGTGSGASDGVIAASPYGARVGGITIHSVPFKLLVETGVAGLAALLWLYGRALRLFVRGLKNTHPPLRAHSGAFLVLGAALFLITLVQPFMALAIFPFILGVAAGPLAPGKQDADTAGPSRLWTIGAAALVAGIVLGNAIQYHRTVAQVRPFVESLVAAALAERAGDWEAAQSAYSSAYALFKADGSPMLHDARYYKQAAEALDVAYAYDRMGARYRRLHPLAAICYGQGRTDVAQAYAPLGVQRLKAAAQFEPRFAQAHFTAAEVLWNLGAYGQALAGYARAREVETVRENAEFRQFVEPLDSFIASKEASDDPAVQLRRAEFLRRRGRWPEAVVLYETVAHKHPGSAEAMFNLGVQRKLEGADQEALDLFNQALKAAPAHYETAREFARRQLAPPVGAR